MNTINSFAFYIKQMNINATNGGELNGKRVC